jgi:hypothetical protein
MIKKLLVPVLCVLLGCAGGAAMGSVTAQTWPEPASAPRWQQEIVTVDSGRGWESRRNQLLRERGEAGWEIVAPMGEHGMTFIFKRPAP